MRMLSVSPPALEISLACSRGCHVYAREDDGTTIRHLQTRIILKIIRLIQATLQRADRMSDGILSHIYLKLKAHDHRDEEERRYNMHH